METPQEKLVEGYKIVRNCVIVIILALIVVICFKSVEYNKLYNEYDLLKSKYQNLQEEFESYKEEYNADSVSDNYGIEIEADYYVVDLNFHFHRTDCSYVSGAPNEQLKIVYTGREVLIDHGYEPCRMCNP